MKQEGILANFNLETYTPESISEATDALIKKGTKFFDDVGAVEPSKVTFDSVIRPLLEVEVRLMNDGAPLDLIQHASTSKELRDSSVASSKKMNSFYVDTSMRKDVFDNVVTFKSSVGFRSLTPEQKRFVEKTIVSGRRNGLHLGSEVREEVKKVMKEISDLATEFSSNLNEDTSFVHLREEELAGVPKDLVDSFERDADSKCKVTMKYPHFFPVTRKCRVPETRRTVETLYLQRCMDCNTGILEKMVALRQRQADLLGYKDNATYVQELRMAKNPKTVKDFLDGLATKMQPIWKKEKEELLKLKEEECKKHGWEFNGKLNFWDMRYLLNLVEETRYAVDKEKLKQYFPLETVTKGLLEIYQDLLGLTFTECKDIDTWHEEVRLFKVQDTETKENFGYFYMDLHPRDGKFGHAAVFPLQPGCMGADGEMQPSLCALMANFSKPTKDKPALLNHDEVVTFFHEFGHVMHNVCSRTETGRFAFLQVEQDFLEAPSQMLENWVWAEEPLKMMSGHYKDGSPIPKDLLEKLVASRIANAGAANLRQIILSTFDQRIHTMREADTQKIFGDTYKEILGVDAIESTNMPASFGHMAGGYDAQYYGYLWSEVYSFDMFETRFKKEGLLNQRVGVEYRNKILRPGASVDASDMLKNFLGREPNDQAFLRSKGLVTSNAA